METVFDLAQRFVGEVHELPGGQHSPFIQWCFESCVGYGSDTPDEVPWCSAFLNRMAWLKRLPRSKSAAARSWLQVGRVLELDSAEIGWDVVILKRGAGQQPGAEVFKAPGHVGLFAGYHVNVVQVLGGNQANGVTVAPFSREQILGIRRLFIDT